MPGLAHDIFVLKRTFAAPAKKVFAALSDPKKKRRWYAEGGMHEVLSYELDFRVGGSEKLAYRFGQGTPVAGQVLHSESVICNIVPGRRVVSTQIMGFGDHCISAALVAIELEEQGDSTELVLTHQAIFFERSDGSKMRRQGWEDLLDRLEQALNK